MIEETTKARAIATIIPDIWLMVYSSFVRFWKNIINFQGYKQLIWISKQLWGSETNSSYLDKQYCTSYLITMRIFTIFQFCKIHFSSYFPTLSFTPFPALYSTSKSILLLSPFLFSLPFPFFSVMFTRALRIRAQISSPNEVIFLPKDMTSEDHMDKRCRPRKTIFSNVDF